MEITILCKIVDNFGDIGVAYRLAKNLKIYYPLLKINLIVSNLSAFHNINSLVSTEKSEQFIEGIFVYDWNDFKHCQQVFLQNDGEKLSIILECFQCGRPDWLEEILFEKKLSRTVQIIMIDYLTAEDYAEDFHCLQSLTRSSKVKKVNFMPGFTKKTGGLIIGQDWEKIPEYNEKGGILFFTYEFSFSPIIKGVLEAAGEKKIMIAQGLGKKSFMDALSFLNVPTVSKKVIFQELPFLDQHEWDAMIKDCSILFVRGEESLSRACLSGIPFVWQAYVQSENYHLVKMNALLSKIKPHFSQEDFKIIEDLWKDFNYQYCVSSLNSEVDKTASKVSFSRDQEKKIYEHCTLFIKKSSSLAEGFRSFAISLRKNGDLCNNLMTFINKNCII